MRLLICTQAVDLDDPVLGFFHRWIVALAKHCETVHVICLKQGRNELPANVIVHSLGKEHGRSRVKYLFNFYRYVWKYRREYNAVFVHMNEEYVLLGGRLWRAWGKKIVLWRNHKMGSKRTQRAGRLAHTVCYTSPEAFVATFSNAVKMPIGIDTEFFSPEKPADPDSILFLGRIDAVKKVDVFAQALDRVNEKGIAFHADIVGDPTESPSKYAHDVRNMFAPLALEGKVTFRPAVTQTGALECYRAHGIYVNLTPSGSFDKTIGEAMACGCLVVAVNGAVSEIVSTALSPKDASSEAAAEAITAALTMPMNERALITVRAREFIQREHSLALLVQKLLPLFV